MKKEMYRYPKEVILEVTNRCNLKCRYCHFHGIEALPGRPLGDMKRKTWENILMQIGEWPGPVTLMTHGAGEPLLYPDLSDLLQKAKKIPHLSVGFMTNGMLLDKSWVARLIELQIDWLALSIDGVVPETHDFFRRRADLRKIEENVMWLI
ncbi:MAG: radical SAM protein, partial [Desulfatiglandaceae bacterium]